ncbi:beta-1,6-galactofuranosyltransferase [Lacticaseibacillus rhamnosus MTCC 5462]|nr:beta-1,6-galactofuranosyltransferase [Lacticaseibacillus rhamnosus MTCC 5462]
MLEGSYGLVWDSESFPDVVGSLGQYERYNTPAKFPMYLSANEPVIVWSEASTANFVKDNDVGLVIDSLDELPQAVASVTEDQYRKMIANIERISPLIRDGSF